MTRRLKSEISIFVNVASAANRTLTKMADSNSDIVTNDDVATWVGEVVADPQTQIIVFNFAMCDFDGSINGEPSGKHSRRRRSLTRTMSSWFSTRAKSSACRIYKRDSLN